MQITFEQATSIIFTPSLLKLVSPGSSALEILTLQMYSYEAVGKVVSLHSSI